MLPVLGSYEPVIRVSSNVVSRDILFSPKMVIGKNHNNVQRAIVKDIISLNVPTKILMKWEDQCHKMSVKKYKYK